MEQKTTTIEGKIISYKTAGDGKAVVLLHGFGADSSIWEEQMAHLKNQYLVIAPDLPGIGGSELTSDQSMEGIAEIIKAIIENEEVEKVALIGHSMGGYATLAFAEKYPEWLTGFGLFHSTSIADNDEKKAAREKGIEFTRSHGAASFLETTAPKMFAKSSKENNQPLYNRFMDELPEMTKEAVIDYYEAMMKRPDRTAILKNAKVPVLFVYGAQDEIIDLDKTIEQASLPAVATVEILKQSGHLGMIEEPAATNRIIEDFLSDL
ncbi:alpha/beta fold hydrolase [Niabella insulamsoli]|uniref:alpha/beta fold hydrolase n=1 Tax=Niabella insulamsoli TaxID=3144874 RepID=UPI0031FC68B2